MLRSPKIRVPYIYSIPPTDPTFPHTWLDAMVVKVLLISLKAFLVLVSPEVLYCIVFVGVLYNMHRRFYIIPRGMFNLEDPKLRRRPSPFHYPSLSFSSQIG